MASEILAGPLGEIRAASTAGGGTALTTTATYIQLPLKTSHLFITARNFSTAVVAQILLNPWLSVLKTADGMDTAPQDFSVAAQDSDTATSIILSDMSTLANRDFLLIGSPIKFAGVSIDVDAPNGNVSAATIEYWNGQGWATITPTDNTDNPAGTTLAIDGTFTWTVPTSDLWKAESIKNLYPHCPAFANVYDVPLFWTRWSFSAALDSEVTLDSLVAINRSTIYFELLSGQTFEEKILHGPGGIGCIQAKTDAGTANLIVNTATLREGKYS